MSYNGVEGFTGILLSMLHDWMQVWSLLDNSIIATIHGHKKPITHMKLVGEHLFTSGGRKVCFEKTALGKVQNNPNM
jgi:hypothetical protein